MKYAWKYIKNMMVFDFHPVSSYFCTVCVQPVILQKALNFFLNCAIKRINFIGQYQLNVLHHEFI